MISKILQKQILQRYPSAKEVNTLLRTISKNAKYLPIVIIFFVLYPKHVTDQIPSTHYLLTAPIEYPFDKAEAKCLADNMYHEARGDGMIGMLAVTNVVFNRLKTRGWPSSICKVVYQPGQFSWTSQPALPIKERQIYAKTYSLAIDILRYRRQSFDITNGALYFHAITLRKKIKTSDTIRIGNHLFYKTRQFGEV